MVSIQRLTKTDGGSGGFVNTPTLKQYPAVLIEYDRVQHNVPGYMDQNSHKVHAKFSFFDADGTKVGEAGPGAIWEVRVNGRGNSMIDGFPPAPAAVLVQVTERKGTGQWVGKSFNEVHEVPKSLEDKILAGLEDTGAGADEPPSFD